MNMKSEAGGNDDADWWVCGNDFCGSKLGKVLRGPAWAPAVVEVLGPGGNPMTIRHRYISLYCAKCGEENNLIAGTGNDSAVENIREIAQKSGDSFLSTELGLNSRLFFDEQGMDPDEHTLGSFFVNAHKRKLLLDKLSVVQARVFKSLQQAFKDEEKGYSALAASVGMTESDFVRTIFEVLDEAYKIERSMSDRQRRQQQEEYHRILNDQKRRGSN